MAQIRHIQPADRDELAALWSLRFHDSAGFIDWFFRERLCPAHSVCMEADGRIVGVIHAWPMRLRIRKAALPALMLCGVATLPGHERQGHMHALMRFILNEARRNGFPLVFHKPNRLAVYASLSQLACTETLYHRVESAIAEPDFSGDWSVRPLLTIYRSAAHYSGCVLRDEKDMRLKLADYRSDGARLITADGGYAILFEQDGGWYGEELLAVSQNAYRALLDRIPAQALVKLPPDLPFSGELRPQNVMGTADVPALLAALCGDASLMFEVNDPVIPENCGVFDGVGSRSARAPALSLSSGELMQYLCGYRAYRSLTREPCFCVDEY